MKNLYVVTHPQSKHHTDGLVGGWYDSGLTDLGLSLASSIGQRIRELLPEDAPAELYSSDLMRAHQTAEAIALCIGAPIQTTADLREKSYGDAEGKPQSWLDERFVHPPSLAIGWITEKGFLALKANGSSPEGFIAPWIESWPARVRIRSSSRTVSR